MTVHANVPGQLGCRMDVRNTTIGQTWLLYRCGRDPDLARHPIPHRVAARPARHPHETDRTVDWPGGVLFTVADLSVMLATTLGVVYVRDKPCQFRGSQRPRHHA
jgi:hypothetical protein